LLREAAGEEGSEEVGLSEDEAMEAVDLLRE
jgi:hypothetical protein